MAIPANRFEFLDKETNVAVKDFLTNNSSSIFSELMPSLGEIGDALGGLMDGGGLMDELSGVMGGEGGLMGGLTSAVGGLTDVANMVREVKDQLSGGFDLSSLGDLDLDKLGETFLGGDMGGLGGLVDFKGMADGLKEQFLGGAGEMIPGMDGLISEGKRLGEVAGDLMGGSDISKMLDGIMGNDSSNSRKVTHLGNQQRALVSIGTMGMQANVPNTFTSISNVVTGPGQLQQIGGAMAARAARNGSVNGVIEIAASPIGGMVDSRVPDINQQFMRSFEVPAGLNSQEQQQLYTDSVQAMNTLQPGWSVTTYRSTTITNAEYLPAAPNPWTELMQRQVQQTVPMISDGLVVTPPSTTALLMAGQACKQSTAPLYAGYGASDPYAVLRAQQPQWAPLF